MERIKVTETPIEGLCVIAPAVKPKDTGYFMETYNQRDMQEAGLDLEFVQDNQTMLTEGTLQGLHYQKEHPFGKLVRCIKGIVYDVAVDLRPDSPTFGKWYGVELSQDNKKQFYMPAGFANGYLVLSDSAVYCYKCTGFYDPDDEYGLAWNDPDLAIDWPGVIGTYTGSASAEGYMLGDGTSLKISKRDQQWPGIKELKW